MSQINSILNLVKTMKQIGEGLKNSVWKQEHIEEIAQARMDICEKCIHIDRSGSSCVVSGTQPCCGLCGCKLSLKIRCLSCECPDEKFVRWPAIMTQADEDEIREEFEKEG